MNVAFLLCALTKTLSKKHFKGSEFVFLPYQHWKIVPQDTNQIEKDSGSSTFGGTGDHQWPWILGV